MADIGAQADLSINQLDQTRIAFMDSNVHFDPVNNTFTEVLKRNVRPSTQPSLDTVLFLMQSQGSDFTDKRFLDQIDFKSKDKESLEL